MLSYSVAQRTREIGIRVALGASRGSVVAMVIRHACLLALTGAALGLAAALRVSPLLRNMLYGVSATDSSIFLASVLLLLGVPAAAAVIPARRAASLDPLKSLRYE